MADPSSTQQPTSSSTAMEVETGSDEEKVADPLLYDLPPLPPAHVLQEPPKLAPLDTNATYCHVYIDEIKFPSMVISGEARVPLNLFKRQLAQKYPSYQLDEIQGEAAIHHLANDLHSHLRNATPEQVSELRNLEKQLFDEPNVEMQLITKTDCERVLGKIREESSRLPCITKSISIRGVYFRIPVQHMCGGGEQPQQGYLYPERKRGRCIQCVDCNKFFTAEDFVMHNHDEQEFTRVVEWGSSPDSWRYALFLAPEAEKIEELSNAFEEFVTEGLVEDEYYPPWYSQKNQEEVKEEGPSTKRSRQEEVVKEDPELVELSLDLVRVLEGVVEMPQVPLVQMDAYDQVVISSSEEKYRAKATLEAMNGKIFDLGAPAKGGVHREQDVQERALQIFRTQQPHIPDPEKFPVAAMEHKGSHELLSCIDQLHLLESSFPDGKPSPAAQQLIDSLRLRLQQEAFQMQQHELIYGTLLSAYKMLTLLYRAHTDPTVPFPADCSDFGEFAQKMASLDPLHFLQPQKKSDSPAAAAEPQPQEHLSENIAEMYLKVMKLLGMPAGLPPPTPISPPPKAAAEPPLANPFLNLFSPQAIDASLKVMGSLNGLTSPHFGFAGLNGLNGKLHSPPTSSKAASYLQPIVSQQLPTSLSMVSPKSVGGGAGGGPLTLDLQKLHSQLFQPLALGIPQ